MRTPARARALWYGPFYLAAVLTVINAVLALAVHRDLQHAITAATLAAVFALWSHRARAEFRRGWDIGFIEGLRMPGELVRGETPPNMVRHATTGDVVPEPWDGYPYSTHPRHTVDLDTDTADDTKE